jgi:hypothetical protein
MGGTCLTQFGLQDDLPCAASLLVAQSKPRFVGTGLVGNGYEAVKTTNDVLYKPLTETALRNLFKNKNRLEAAGSLKLTFLAPGFAAQFAPYQASLNTVIRNVSYPVVGVHAINERRLSLGWAKERWNRVFIGAHLRFFQRRFIHNEFQLFQAVTSSGALVTPFEHSGFGIDPSITWWSKHRSSFRVTIGIENLDWVNRTPPKGLSQPRGVAGIGGQVPLFLGQWEWGLDWRPLSDSEAAAEESFSLGSNYRLGALQILGGLNHRSLSGGLRFALASVDLGVAYTTTRWPGGSDSDYQQTVMTQIGVGF